jgi:K+/H+ antiporter YhaU regulatory subunit KhtT
VAGRVLEVTEEAWNRALQIEGALAKIVNNSQAKLLLQKAHKLADPTAITPELDRENAENDRVAGIKKEFDEYKAEQAKREAEAEQQRKITELSQKIDAGLSDLKSRHRLTDEGVAAVRKIMDEEGIINPATAYAALEKRHPPQDLLTPRGNTSWNFMAIDDADTGAGYAKKLIETKGQNDLVLDREVFAALNDVRAR